MRVPVLYCYLVYRAQQEGKVTRHGTAHVPCSHCGRACIVSPRRRGEVGEGRLEVVCLECAPEGEVERLFGKPRGPEFLREVDKVLALNDRTLKN